MNAVDLLAIGAWPLAALGVWISRKSLAFAPNDIRRYLLSGLAAVMLVGPLVALLVLFPHHSASVLATEYALMIGIGLLVLFAAWRTHLRRLKLVAAIMLGFACFGWGLWHLAGDFLIRRARVDGFVSDKQYEKRNPSCSRCSADYYVYVGGRRYRATATVFQAAETGQRIRARVGRASRRIMSIEVLPL